VQLGVSTENQQYADERIPWLLKTPAAVRFVSAEPLLGPIDLKPAPISQWPDGSHWMPNKDEPDDWKYWMHRENGISLVIVGGESGPGARPSHPDWVRRIRDQCVAAGTKFFFKQWGEWWPGESGRLYRGKVKDWSDGQPMVRTGKHAAGRLLDGRTHDDLPQ
jgi:protein gp37